MPPKRKIVSDDEDDDFEDIDELVSDEDEDVKPSDVRSILRGGLSQPLYTTTSLRQLHDIIHLGTVDLNPSYQRDVVWSEAKMISLIQSLFLNYYIPPVMFAVETNELGEDLRTCIDGKQRCTSVVNFMDGKIPFVSPYTRERYWFRTTPEQKRGRLLPDSLKRRFEQIQLQAAEYREITDIQQRDLFQRVQMGVSLSTAERLQAIPGPWPTWVTELIKKYITEPGTLGTAITWEQKRGRPFQNIAAFIILAYESDRNSVPSAQAIEAFFKRDDAPDRHFVRKVEMALSLFVNIAVEHFDESFGVIEARIAPVEFVYTALLIFNRMGVLSIARLAAYIGKMRQHIRYDKGHVDVRANSRVSKDFADYIRALPKKPSPNESPAAEEFEGDEVDPRNIRAAKRARRAEEEDPTYRATAVDRYDVAGLGNATRGAKSGRAGRQSSPPPMSSAAARNRAAAAQLPPAAPNTRPQLSSMDRPPAYDGDTYGQGPEKAYTVQNSAYPQPTQWNGQQAAYGQPGQQQQYQSHGGRWAHGS